MISSASRLLFDRITAVVGIVFVYGAQMEAKADAPYVVAWGDQFGTSSFDAAVEISVDSLGYAYVSGSTLGTLVEGADGENRGFLVKYNSSGERIWTRQDNLGLNPGDDTNTATGVSADGLGNVYLAGFYNSIAGDCCGFDFYLRKYDDDGGLAWTRTIQSTDDEEAIKVAADQLGNVFIGGTTWGSFARPIEGLFDGFVAKYNGAGEIQWTRQFGGSGEDYVFDVSADGLGNAYLAGYQQVDDDGQIINDAFVTKFDADGNQLWTSYLGAIETFDLALDVHADEQGNVYLVGQTESNLGSPAMPTFLSGAFVAKFDANGIRQWARIIETETGFATATGVTANGSGIHVVGDFVDADSTSAFVSKYSTDGSALGMIELESGEFVSLSSIASTGHRLYASGSTRDSLFGPIVGGTQADAIVVRLLPIPEPAGCMLAIVGAVGMAISRRRKIRAC